VISKEGPRHQMRVKTSAAVAGVRGTDFFISDTPQSGTQVAVIRGEVSLGQESAPADKVLSVKKGYIASVPKEGASQVKEATKEQLKDIQKDSVLQPTAKEIAELPKADQEEVKTLSEAAKKAVLADVKKDDPGLFEKLSKQKNIDAEAMNSAALANVVALAPVAVKKKPTLDEINATDKNVYDKYDKSAPKKK
jgi:hypothetical protein